MRRLSKKTAEAIKKRRVIVFQYSLEVDDEAIVGLTAGDTLTADAIGHGWWDLVSTDLESQAYAVAAAVLASAGVGGSDIRHRLYFVGMADAAEEALAGQLRLPAHGR
jgi:site-specific DNA-cytosine methylase